MLNDRRNKFIPFPAVRSFDDLESFRQRFERLPPHSLLARCLDLSFHVSEELLSRTGSGQVQKRLFHRITHL